MLGGFKSNGFRVFYGHFIAPAVYFDELTNGDLRPLSLSGRARLRRALTGQIEPASATVDDPEMQLGEVVV